MKFLMVLIFIGFTDFSFASGGHDKKAKAHKEHSEGEKNHADDKDHDESGHKRESEGAHKEEKANNEADHKHEGEEGHEEEKEHSEAGHNHEGEEGHEHEKDHDDAGHKHEGEEGHEEENTQVGPDKGILEASEDDGIKLSPEAEKNFDIERIEVSNLSSISIEKSILVTSGVETNLYRYRNGFYKRIDFKILSKNGNKLVVTSRDLSKGDSIVTKGLGFILIAEIAAFGGAPEGHSH